MGPIQNRKDVWLNDLPFSHTDDNGNRWIITDIDGWWDLPSPSMSAVERSYSEDGNYYEPGRFDARVIRLTGKIIPTSNIPNAANMARQELNRRLMLVRKTGLLQVMESPELGGGKQSEVIIVARPLVSAERLNGVLDFDIQFRAPDPRKYSVDLSVAEAYISGEESSGRSYHLTFNRTYAGEQDRRTTLVQNDGDYNTYGTVRLSGPIDSPGVHHLDSGRIMQFTDLRLAVGQYIDINLLEKTIISESGISLRDRLDDSSKWFRFEAGDTKVALMGNQYLDYIPSVPDVKNLVTNPSYEADTGSHPRTVRRSYTPNPSGTTQVSEYVLRESVFPDQDAEDPENFTEGSVEDGKVRTPTTNLLDGGETEFPETGQHYFVQLDFKPDTDSVEVAEVVMGDRSSGEVALDPGTWTTARVDSYIPSDDIEIQLKLPGASSSDQVQIRNIMVIRSRTPIAGEIPLWSPVPGEDEDGVETEEMMNGGHREVVREPMYWSLPNNPDSLLRVIGDDVYLIPSNDEPHLIDFGPANMSGNDITYGVEAQGVESISVVDPDTGVELHSSVPSHIAANYISDYDVKPSVQAVIDTTGGRKRLISTVMVTYDGGTKIFSDRTPNEDGYLYDNYSTYTTAREMVDSYVTPGFPVDDKNIHARVVSDKASDGSRSLEIVYNIVGEDQPSATPITQEVDPVPEGTYYVRAKVMSNQSTTFDVKVEGIDDHEPVTYSANPHHWSDVSFSFEAPQSSRPYLSITPPPGSRGLEYYVDAVGIMTEDEPYFDGSTEGPYVWTGAPHMSTSATIPVVGVPKAKMEIMYRNSWIG